MASMSYREYRLRLSWLDREEQRDTKTHWYLMQIAQKIQQSASKKPNSVKLEKMKLSWKKPNRKKQSVEDAKNIWLTALGIKADD